MEHLYVSAWADPKRGTGSGLLHYAEDGNGRMRCVQSFPMEQMVNLIEIDREKKQLFVLTNGSSEVRGGCGGAVFVYTVADDGMLAPLQKFSSGGTSPIGLAFLQDRLAVVNHGTTDNRVCRTVRKGNAWETAWVYDEANLVLFRRQADGTAGQMTDLHRFRGHGPVPFFQETAAPHSLAGQNGMLFVPERGSDRTSVFTLREGRLKRTGTLPCRKGFGPRNAAVTKDGRDVYIVTEILPYLIRYRLPDPKPIAYYETAGAAARAACDTDCRLFTAPHPSAVLLSENENYLYTLTRSTNTAAVFQRDTESGALSFLQEWHLQGENPREIVQRKKRLYIVFTDTGACDALTVDEHTGRILGEERFLENIPGISGIRFFETGESEEQHGQT